MTERDEFLGWVETTLHDAEVALHEGDPGPRLAIWSRAEPVSVLGAWRNARGRREVEDLFAALGKTFSGCPAYRFELLTCDVVGDLAYTTGFEHTTAVVDGETRTYTLRATQVYRREDGEWRVAHRHGDTVTA
ncbi:nuclear transport factor 2 family protein [Amycolatopsis rhabdoformis]|uniref:Nuclear transport factor 2 family protein n=1 Tax=Amycolatopsis rhabdoformis TaxID=1448059 RepID=A0ABZ1IHY0_9PSEU|nr:nuclear transport factor 2 family protein [Amycolatopsis rhabdoformis]WSE33323.1 nuclear transport factor 2 family protein [Amycolatopsis rhabdoformis]